MLNQATMQKAVILGGLSLSDPSARMVTKNTLFEDTVGLIVVV